MLFLAKTFFQVNTIPIPIRVGVLVESMTLLGTLTLPLIPTTPPHLWVWWLEAMTLMRK